MEEKPVENTVQQPLTEAAAPAPAKPKARVGRIIGLCAAALLVLAAALFLLFWFSADARFDRAMTAAAFDEAETILQEGKLRASEKNDGHYLTLADTFLERFRSGADDFEAAAQHFAALKSAKTASENTGAAISARENRVIGLYAERLRKAYESGQTDYESAMQSLIELCASNGLDRETGETLEAQQKAVTEAHLGAICDAYRSGEIDYETAVRQLNESNPFGDAAVQTAVGVWLVKTAAARETLYADALRMITEDESEAGQIRTALEFLGDYRGAGELAEIFRQIEEEDPVEAAKRLAAYRETDEAAEDVAEAIGARILNDCFAQEVSNNDYSGKLDRRIRLDCTNALLGDDSGKITTLFGSETSKALTLRKEFDPDWFAACKGGTGKILYIARYLNSSSGDTYDAYYYYRYENPKDIPTERMPESLEEVEYLILFEQGGTFYDRYHSSSGSEVQVYRRTVQIKVLHFPSGELIYDSGVLTGPVPKSTLTVFTGSKYAYGDDPDLSDVTAEVKSLVGLE